MGGRGAVSRATHLDRAANGQDALHTDSEELLLIKTAEASFGAMKRRLLELHPYEVPELIAVPVAQGHEAYLEWVRQQSRG